MARQPKTHVGQGRAVSGGAAALLLAAAPLLIYLFARIHFGRGVSLLAAAWLAVLVVAPLVGGERLDLAEVVSGEGAAGTVKYRPTDHSPASIT